MHTAILLALIDPHKPTSKRVAEHSLPTTLVLAAACVPSDRPNLSAWSGTAALICFPIPKGPTRVVINCAYAWCHLLFASQVVMEQFGVDMHTPSPLFPATVQEIVFHFMKIDRGERPRYVRWKATRNNAGFINGRKIKEHLTVSSPIPTLGANEFLDVFRVKDPTKAEGHQTGMDLFASIADVYTRELIARTEKAKGHADLPSRPLKLTLVGLDEFDDERDKDAADDDVFEAKINQLPWHGTPPPRSAYEYPPYQPVAPSFVESVARFVDPSLRATVKENVKVLSTADYHATLSTEARYEEDWWCDQHFDDVVCSGFGGMVGVLDSSCQ
jgi:hypothetical protein